MKLLLATALLAASSTTACHRFNPLPSSGSCGAAVRVVSTRGHVVTLEITNVTDDAIEIGASPQASFVDTHGTAMEAEMTPGEDDWFMPFHLPARSHRQVTVRLSDGGDPSALDRIEIPHSGDGFVPECTIQLSGLAAEKSP